jgi:hypothetical protein
MSARDQEFRYFEAFLRARPDLQLTSFVHSDSPDFLAYSERKKVGVEVTRFSPQTHKASPNPEEQDSLRRRTMDLAYQAYRATGGAPLHVQATFSPYQRLTKGRVTALAREMVSFLSNHSRPLLVYDRADFTHWVGDEFLPELTSLTAFRVSTEEHSGWHAGQSGWVRHADERDIRRVVSGKESRITTYRAHCEELWLVIVFELLGGDTYVRPPATPLEFGVATNFDRVFCLAPIGSVCVDVPVLPIID